MTYNEMKAIFRNHEKNNTGGKHLVGCIVFTSDSFSAEYSEDSRTYRVSSDCKAFVPGMGGYSIFGSSLDGSDMDVRLDWYMADEKGGKEGWKVERCYLLKETN